MRLTFAAAIACCALFTAPAIAWGMQSPTLGELALKEQERRRALKGTSKVLTDLDLPKTVAPVPASPVSGAPAPAAPPAVAAETAAPRRAEEPGAADAKTEAWWRRRISQARDDLRRSGIFVDALQTRVNALSLDVASRDDPYQRARLADDRQKTIAELERLKTDIELQKKRVAEIEEEARLAGIPPGWLR